MSTISNIAILKIDRFSINEESPNSPFELRGVEVKEVEKMLRCQNDSRGYFLYHYPNCGNVKVIHLVVIAESAPTAERNTRINGLEDLPEGHLT